MACIRWCQRTQPLLFGILPCYPSSDLLRRTTKAAVAMVPGLTGFVGGGDGVAASPQGGGARPRYEVGSKKTLHPDLASSPRYKAEHTLGDGRHSIHNPH